MLFSQLGTREQADLIDVTTKACECVRQFDEDTALRISELLLVQVKAATTGEMDLWVRRPDAPKVDASV